MSLSSPNWLPLDQALNKLASLIQPVTEKETVSVTECCGRVLAQPVYSPINVPAFANSAMDGYAMRYADIGQVEYFESIGESFAGSPFSGEVEAGQCVRIMTGAVIPRGADTVVMQENTAQMDGKITVVAPVRRGEAVRPVGNDIRQDALVLEQNKRLTPLDVGLLSSLGIATIDVLKNLTVAVMSTGDELTQPASGLIPGHIYDSNRPMLLAMLAQRGYQTIDLGIVPDDKQALRDAFEQADNNADLVLCSGGVSVGEADYTKDVLEEIGQVDFWKIAIKPGKPLAFGRLSKSLFVGLPGNPVSAMVTYLQIAEAALDLMSGQQPISRLRLTAIADEDFRKRPGRLDFQRALCWAGHDGDLRVKPMGNQSSGVLSSFSQSNCFAVLELERGSVFAGEQVTIELFDSRLTN